MSDNDVFGIKTMAHLKVQISIQCKAQWSYYGHGRQTCQAKSQCYSGSKSNNDVKGRQQIRASNVGRVGCEPFKACEMRVVMRCGRKGELGQKKSIENQLRVREKMQGSARALGKMLRAGASFTFQSAISGIYQLVRMHV